MFILHNPGGNIWTVGIRKGHEGFKMSHEASEDVAVDQQRIKCFRKDSKILEGCGRTSGGVDCGRASKGVSHYLTFWYLGERGPRP